MANELDVLDTTVQKTYTWINEVAAEAGWEDRQKAYLALRAVLHTLRDRLTIEEGADLSAQLPMLVRGIYYEGWRPSATPSRIRQADQFLDAVARRFPNTGEGVDPHTMIKAVFRVIERNIADGEARHVVESLPKDVRELLAA